MLDLSKYFQLDIVDTNQSLKPVILILSENNEPLFTLTEDNIELIYNGELLECIPCINKVSSVRVSQDFDSKKLKINRLRCTLYNYYNVNKKISEHINQSIENNNINLYYKSTGTNILFRYSCSRN